MSNWTLAQRAATMNPSVIREILKVTEKPGIISLAGGLPSPKTFPIDAFANAADKVLRQDGAASLQYAASEGYGPLREFIAQQLPWDVSADHVLITTGSQQGLDLVGKILLDEGSRLLVETPTYLGALQAFSPQQPKVVGVDSDNHGVIPADLDRKVGEGADKARMIYLLPNFQNPTGRTMDEARRQAVVERCAQLGLPFLEDNPYGDLWYDEEPAAPLTARNPEGGMYLGSFSKVLAPGLRLGYIVAPKHIYPKLLQAKQAADLHTPTFNQRMVAEVIQNGFLDRHVPTIRALYKKQRDAMLAALEQNFADLDVQWTKPVGGMFLWLRMPAGIDTVQMLPAAVERNVAYVPGSAFYANDPDHRTMRLSYVTASEEQIHIAIKALADTVRASLAQR